MHTATMAFPRKEAARLVGAEERVLAGWASSRVLRPSEGSLYSFNDLVGLRALVEMRKHKVHRRSLLAALDEHGRDQSIWSSKKFEVLAGKVHVFKGRRLERPDTGQQAEVAVIVKPSDLRAEVTRSVIFGRTRQPESFGKIVQNRGVCGGRPRFAGTRLEVATIERLVAANWPDSKIFKEYPSLKREDLEVVRSGVPARRERSA